MPYPFGSSAKFKPGFYFSLQRPLMDTIVNDLESDTHVSMFNLSYMYKPLNSAGLVSFF